MSSTPEAKADDPSPQCKMSILDSCGCYTTVSDQDIALRPIGSGFAWIDLEEIGDAGVQAVSQELGLSQETVGKLLGVDRRPAFERLTDATYSAVPMLDPKTVSTHPPYLCVALTDRALITRHGEPSPVLDEFRARCKSLPEAARANGPSLMLHILDTTRHNLEELLLSLDERLDAIQVSLLTNSPTTLHEELVDILRTLTQAVQGLTWYSSDLEDVSTTVAELPGMHDVLPEEFARHRDRVISMRESARNYREEAKDALEQYASNIGDRQGELINVLTLVATLFLPLTFLTGFFGMNFGVIVNDLNSPWAFVLLGLMLPAASVAATLLLFRKLRRRFRLGKSATTHP